MIPWLASEGAMRPKQQSTTGSADLFRARLEQIINMKHELVQLAGKLDWTWIDGEIAPLYSDQGRPGIETRFVIGLRKRCRDHTRWPYGRYDKPWLSREANTC
jgi:hypothetical protein